MRPRSHNRVPIRIGLVALAALHLLGARACLSRTDYRQAILLESENDPKLRVALVRDAPSLDLAVPGRHERIVEGDSPSAEDRPGQERIRVSNREGRIVWGGETLESSSVRLLPGPGGCVEVNGTPYRGSVRIQADAKGAIRCVNEIPLETYLAGVLGAEVPTTWPDAALRAQAIAARTYALHSAWQKRDADWDLTADTLSQVYKGLDAEDPTAFRIVHETRGVILVYGDKIFPSYFMSVCGGHTASSAKVFGDPAIPPLSGTACGYCRGAPRFRWPAGGDGIFFSETAIVASLQPLGIPFHRIDRIDGLQTDPDGHAARVSLQSGGETFTVSARDFRMALGPDRLLSSSFRAEKREGGFVFRGKGWGHGVGLCQWGAYGMGRAGHGERRILRHYYPGADLVRISAE